MRKRRFLSKLLIGVLILSNVLTVSYGKTYGILDNEGNLKKNSQGDTIVEEYVDGSVKGAATYHRTIFPDSEGGSGAPYTIPELINIDLKLQIEKDVSSLDASKIINANKKYGADYRVDITLDDTLAELPELSTADVYETENTDTHTWSIDSNGDDEYKSRLSYLLHNNILTRDTNFIYNAETIFIDSTRYLAKDGNSKNSGYTVEQTTHKYYNSKVPVSKTDLLVALMRTNEVKKSKTIWVMHPYKRLNEANEYIPIEMEPAIASPYSDKLGELGRLTSLEKTIVFHDNYKQVEGFYTSDVAELYLRDAQDKGIFSENDLDISSPDVIDYNNANNKYFTDSCLNTWAPTRQFYTITNNKRVWDDGGVNEGFMISDIPGDIDESNPSNRLNPMANKYGTTSLPTKKGAKSESNYTGGTLAPFGNTFSYSCDPCKFSDPYSQTPVQIVKRLSCVEVNFGIKDSTRPEDTGYRYFKNENMSVLDAYVLAAKAMQLKGTEQALTDSEVEIITSRYALNIEGTTDEELHAVRYLIAQGVINGEDSNLTYAKSKDFTNDEFVKLLYYINNKDVRFQNLTAISVVDQEMVQQGYAQARIHLNSDVPIVDSEVQYVTSDETSEARINKDRVKSPNEYDYIYVRMPLSVKKNGDSVTKTLAPATLYTKSNPRGEIDPINSKLNGGKKKEEIEKLYPELPKDQKSKAVEIGKEGWVMSAFQNDAVFKDPYGYTWNRYIVHKDYSSNIFIHAIVNGVSTSFTGISGKGVYYLDPDNSTDFVKFDFSTAKDYLITKDLYKYVIEPDLKIQDMMSRESIADSIGSIGERVPDITGIDELLWTQYAFAAENSNATDVIVTMGTKEALDNKMYNGVKMFNINEDGDIELNPDCMDSGTLSKYEVRKVEVGPENNKEINYQLIYKNVGNDAIFEGRAEYNKMSNINEKTTLTEDVKGYMKVGSDENATILISQDELENFGVQVNNVDQEQVNIVGGEKGTGRLLYNPNTGQRAFINSVDSYTMIGNNITQYKPGELMVIASDGKIYYNLKIMLELLNDTDSVIERAGKDLLVSLIDENSINDKFKLVDIYDSSNATITGKKSIVDRTYLMTNDDYQNVFMSLSALTGYCSNFIYYKSHLDNNSYNALVVYKPKAALTDKVKIENGKVVHYDGPSKTENGLLQNSEKYTGVVQSQVVDKNNNLLAKRLYLSTLLGANNIESANELIYGDYDLTVYLIGSDSTPDARAITVSKFLNFLSNGSSENYKALIQHSYTGPYDYINMEKYHNEMGTNLSTISGVNHVINLSYLTCDTMGNAEKNLILHNSTGNLYYKIATENNGSYTNHQDDLQEILGQRFYLNISKDKIDSPDYRQHVFLNFRQYKVYENTPTGCIPLEVYGSNYGANFNTLLAKNGLTKYDFGESKPYHLFMPETISINGFVTKQSASGHMYGFRNTMLGTKLADIGFGTTLYGEPIELSKDEFKKLYYKDDGGTLTPVDSDTFADNYFDLMVSKMEGVLSGFPLRKALGMEGSNAVSIGYDKKMTSGAKIEMIKGSSAVITKSNVLNMPKLLAFYNQTSNKPKVLLDVSSSYDSNLRDVIPKLSTEIIVPSSNTSNAGATRLYYDNSGTKDDYIENIADFISAKGYDLQGTLSDWNSTGQSGVWIIPMITIPAGTTLVDKNYDLIYSPNDTIRNEQKVPNNILNTLLLKVAISSGLEEYTYLGEIPEGSIVKFENNFQVVKVSGAQEMANKVESIDTSKYQYARCVTDLLDMNCASSQKSDSSLFYEINLLEQYLTKVANIRVPYNFGVTDTSVSLDSMPSIFLTSILGKSKYRLPTIDEAKKVLNTNASCLGWTTNDSNNVYLMNTVVDESGLPANLTSDTLEYSIASLPISEIKTRTKQLTTGDTSGDIGLTSLVLDIEPTVVVKKVGTDALSDIYEVVNYHDFGSMLFDNKGIFTSYLKSCDTEIPDITSLVSASKVEQYPADNYINAEQLKQKSAKFGNDYLAFFRLLILCVFIVWAWIVAWWVLLKIPATRKIPNFIIYTFTFTICTNDTNLRFQDIILRTIYVALIVGFLVSGGYFLIYNNFIQYL